MAADMDTFGNSLSLIGEEKLTQPITADSAREISKAHRKRKTRGSDANYTLTIGRLYARIDAAARRGHDSLTFQAPKYVLGGCISDRIVLARQIKARLTELGYRVSRNEYTLTIKWAAPEADATKTIAKIRKGPPPARAPTAARAKRQ